MQLIKKDMQWKWSADEREAFENIKAALSMSCVLQHYDSKLKTEIVTDAGLEAVSAILIQYTSTGERKTVM